MKSQLICALACAAIGCSTSATSYTDSHPPQFVGRWVLGHPDGTWGDTTTWNPDGQMAGSTHHRLPPDAQWVVRTAASGASVLCVSGGNEWNCQPYRTLGDTLMWGIGADADRFRHLP